MNHVARSVLVALVIAAVPACNKAAAQKTEAKAAEPVKAATTAVREVTIPEVAQILKDKSGVVVDANGDETRKEFGVIPGALLLTSHKSFAMTELPAEKATRLVFYCGGTQCRASDSAAERASGAGYTNVAVLRDGIRGWKGAGQPTDTPRS